MITISLDEQGVFEHIDDIKDQGIVMIAGIIYDDHGDESDAEREKTRIKNYFTQICEKYKVPYPRALHFGGGWTNKFVGLVKREYSKTLGDFLQNGTYNGIVVPSADGRDRSGEYYTFALIKSPKGKPELLSEDVSNLIKEDYASNLYMHMAEDVISRILFYNNFFLDKNSVSLDLATRVYKGQIGEDVSNHTALGYEGSYSKTGDMVRLTNSHVFRTALAREMLYETENDILVKSLEARSINYFTEDDGLEFLYLADAVCTCIGFKTKYTSPSYVMKAWNRMQKLTMGNSLLFIYDAVDTGFVKAWKYIDSGNIYKALSVFYDSVDDETQETAFYKEHWECVLIKHIERKIDTSAYSMAVRQFAQSTRNNNLKPEKLLFIFENLNAIKDLIIFNNTQDKAVFYDLYDAGAATYNHIGNTELAQKCLDLCDHYAKYAGVERELRNRNKYVVSLCDSLQYKKAINVARATYDYYSNIFEIQKSIFGDNNANVNDFGIINSQLGQCYAFLNEGKAEKYFNSALALFDHGTPDYYQTESYLLHYYVQTNNREEYLRLSKELFGNYVELEDQLKYIVDEGTNKSNPLISFKFALFIYLKGLYSFRLDKMNSEEKTKIVNLRETLLSLNKEIEDYFEGYPWVLIDKYLALICIELRSSKASDYFDSIINTKYSMEIMKLIKHCAAYAVAVKLENKKIAEQEANQAISAYQIMTKGANLNTVHDMKSLNQIVTFLYC